MQNSTLIRPTHELAALKKLIPVYQSGIARLQDLAMQFSVPGWKDFFVHLWSQQANSLTELEEKIWEMGGDTASSRVEQSMDSVDLEETGANPILLDKTLLMRCLNQQTYLLHLHADVRRTPMPFDVRMILLRHRLQVREMVDRLSSMYLAYPHRKGTNFEAIFTTEAA
jgi:hypothetical protein